AVAIVPHPVDDSVLSLVTAPAVPGGDKALVIPASRLLQRFGQLFLGFLVLVSQLRKIADRRVSSPGAGRFVGADAHCVIPKASWRVTGGGWRVAGKPDSTGHRRIAA